MLAGTATKNRLQSFLNVQPGEGGRVALMMLYSAAAMGVVMTMGYAVEDALFLSSLPTSATAFVLILPAITIFFTLLFYGRIAARFPLTRLAPITLVISIIVFGLFRIGLATPLADTFGLLAALYVLIDTCVTLLVIQFWAFAGEVFNPREAKRLFGLIVTGGTLVSMLTGLTLGPLSALIGVPNLLIVMMGALVVVLFCVLRLRSVLDKGAGEMEAVRGEEAEKQTSFAEDLRGIRSSPLLLAIAGFLALMSLFIFTGIYQLSIALQLNFPGDDQAMVAFLGQFEFWTGLAALIIQFFVISRVMKRRGVFTALLVYPLGIALTSVLVLMTGGALWAITLLRACDPIFRRTFGESGINVLYLPIPTQLRQRAIELFEALAAVVSGVLGVAILIMQDVPGWSYVYWAVPMLFGAGLWAVLVRRTQPQYQRSLAESLKKRTLDFEGETIDITDEATVQVLIGALSSSDELYVLQALSLISAAPNVDWDPHVAPLLAHPSPEVRIAVLKQIGREDNTAYAEQVAALLNSPDQAVRAAAIEAYCAIARPNAIARIAPFLSDGQPALRGAAVAGLIVHDGPAGRTQAEALLTQMSVSHEVQDRRAAARAIGLISRASDDELLLPLLDDPDREVEVSAIQAAGLRHNPALMPQLMGKLCDKDLGTPAVEALVQYGPAIEPQLEALLADPSADRTARAQVPVILRRIGTTSALEILLKYVDDPDEIVRTTVDQSLVRLRTTHPDFVLPTDTVRGALQAEIRQSYLLYVLRQDLNTSGADLLLDDTLQAREHRTLDRIFWLLELLYPNRKVERVREAIEDERGGTRAAAIELLDNLAEHDIKENLIPLLEAPPPEVIDLARQRFAIARASLNARLGDLSKSDDGWLRALAVYRIGALSLPDLADAITSALQADDALLRETALAAGRQVLDREHYLRVLHAQASDDRYPGAQQYAQAYLRQL